MLTGEAAPLGVRCLLDPPEHNPQDGKCCGEGWEPGDPLRDPRGAHGSGMQAGQPADDQPGDGDREERGLVPEE
jgi:hypothetical protein